MDYGLHPSPPKEKSQNSRAVASFPSPILIQPMPNLSSTPITNNQPASSFQPLKQPDPPPGFEDYAPQSFSPVVSHSPRLHSQLQQVVRSLPARAVTNPPIFMPNNVFSQQGQGWVKVLGSSATHFAQQPQSIYSSTASMSSLPSSSVRGTTPRRSPNSSPGKQRLASTPRQGQRGASPPRSISPPRSSTLPRSSTSPSKGSPPEGMELYGLGMRVSDQRVVVQVRRTARPACSHPCQNARDPEDWSGE